MFTRLREMTVLILAPSLMASVCGRTVEMGPDPPLCAAPPCETGDSNFEIEPPSLGGAGGFGGDGSIGGQAGEHGGPGGAQ